MLKNSVRNSRPRRSLLANRVFLNTAKSKLSIPSERNRGSTRDSSPNVKSAGAAKHAVLNHPSSREGALPDTPGLQPGTRLGREPPPNSVVPFACPFVNASGKPRWKMVTPSIPHPPTILSYIPSAPPRYFFPLPKGRSKTWLMTKRWGTSCEDKERSPRKLLLS
jgi:hypothetical protein